MFSRIAIVNRGEPAMRLIHAVRDLNAQTGSASNAIQTIALYTDADRTAMFVREADVAYPLGPASALPYLDFAVLERALRDTGADAAWVGWGFVAEDPNFAELCSRLGVTFVGPSSTAMRRLGDKIGSKLLAEAAGVPVAAWSGGPVDTVDDALTAAKEIGYPLMLKASAGGGGRGIRRIASDDELVDAYQRTRDEAARAFGSGTVFLERQLTGARHVEVQVIADSHGTAWPLGVRDCTIQRRNQKIIEESASPVLAPEQSAELKAAAARLITSVGYSGAATVEFLYQPDERAFAFLEVNTRLQVEHPITEITTDTDLVRAQLHVASGGRLDGPIPQEVGHAVEARLNAEDPDRDFAPSPGRVALLELPAGPGIRVDTGVGEGDTVPSEFDSMIAKIIATGRTRDEALARLRRAVGETVVIIEGGTTNKSFVLDLLAAPEVIDGRADTGWIDRVRGEGRLVSHRHSGVALVAAGIAAYEEEKQVEIRRLLDTAHGGRPQVQHRVGRPIELRLRGNSYKVAVAQVGPRRYQVTVTDGTAQTVFADLDRLGDYHVRLTVDGRRHRLVMATHGPVHLVEVDGVTHRVARDEGGVLRAPAPALVVSTPVAVGEEVAAGAPVLVLESMKMETLLNAPFAGRVRELLVATGSQVETGAPLVRLEPVGDGDDDAAPDDTGGVDLDLPDTPPEPSAAERAAQGIAELSAIVMGFDLDGTADTVALGRYLTARDELAATGQQVTPREVPLVGLFADFAELSRNRPAGEERNLETRVHSPREHFHTYLQSLDAERTGLPQAFRDRLARVLRHYELETLDRTPALEEAVFRVFLAQRRSHPDVLVVSSILQRWLDAPPPQDVQVAANTRDVLDRLVLAAQLRFPSLGDLARSVRFRWFDQPLVDRARASVLAGVRGELTAIDAATDPTDRARRMDALAEIPEQIVRFLSERLDAGVPEREPMLEVLIRRHYREYELEELRSIEVDGRPFAVADYVLDERPSHLVSTLGRIDELTDERFTNALGAQLARRRNDQEAVADLYLSWPDAPESPEEQSSQLAQLLGATPFARSVRRVALGACIGDGQVAYFTFRPGGGGMVEDDNVRGVHPMVGRRLNLWRLRDFDITRIDAPEDVLLYHCVAKANAADQRLVALAQVRQLAVLRDELGRVSSLAQVERAIANCVEAIRRARAAMGGGRNAPALDMNHVWVHIWPVIEAELDQLTALRRQIAPLTVGAGIEEVLAVGRVATGASAPVPIAGRFFYEAGSGVQFALDAPPTERLKPLDDYQQKVLRARRRGTVYPYELHSLLTGPAGTFTEYDIEDTADAVRLVPVERPPGLNKAGLVVGVVTTPTALHPDGITRVSLAGDPTKSLGAVAEAECARVIAALDLADRLAVPVEWFALSAGARISMDSGTENMDWVARALKRIVEFTQNGGEINIVVAGINVGAQPYWNAEATMLMHTRGILIMTPESAMVLTGKQSLDFSGGVSAEDNFGIGGYDRVMGPNGQAQYWAPDLAGARDILMAHYQYAYVPPGSSAPRLVPTTDPVDRDVTVSPHSLPESDFRTVGDIFSADTNPDRKKPFDIRTLMRALADQDLPTLERWSGMADADTAVVQDAYLGGAPVCLLGIESKTVPRHGFPPTDGPDTYTAGTLFPRSSKKAARAINAASGNRPLVVLANLSGFDGSPDSMRNLQLEYGAEIGRAIVNFRGPIVFCVISRYHGGAFVVFSKALNPQMTVLAVEGSFASVIGGAPAAAVVFAAEVDARTSADSRVQQLRERFTTAAESDRAVLGAELVELRAAVRAEKLGEVAAEFDGIHDIHRAVAVGSVDAVISARELRPAIIEILHRRSPAE